MTEPYRIFAVKYATLEGRRSSANFLGGDLHDYPMPLDYYVWAIVGESQTFVVDTGFNLKTAEKRGRQIVRPPVEGLKAIGVDPEHVTDVILTHMHYDHAGNCDLFPAARFHLQEREMHFCTGRCMCHAAISHHYESDDVAGMVHRLFAGRVKFHPTISEIAPGILLHHVGGHTDGLQVVRVNTKRGMVVLASDASHFYANIEQGRPFPIIHNAGDMLDGYEVVRRLADSTAHVVPGHDPDVLRRYPSPRSDMEGWIVSLDQPPAAGA